MSEILIHLADPQLRAKNSKLCHKSSDIFQGLWSKMLNGKRPVVIIVFTLVVCKHSQDLVNQNQFQVKTMFASIVTVGLTKWIIDDTCLVPFL